MGSIGNNDSSVQSYINEWKAQESQAVVSDMKEWRNKWLEWNEKETFMNRTALERNIPQVYLSAVKANYKSEENMEQRFNNVATSLIDAHFEALKSKVADRIGDIVNIRRIGGANDYDMTGSNGNTVRVQVVMAGGYNKQRRHTRWVMNKLGGRK